MPDFIDENRIRSGVDNFFRECIPTINCPIGNDDWLKTLANGDTASMNILTILQYLKKSTMVGICNYWSIRLAEQSIQEIVHMRTFNCSIEFQQNGFWNREMVLDCK